MKQYLRKIEIKILWSQVARLRQKHKPIVIAVAGSIGKTGTKTAIATVLSEQMTVRWQDGNYNDITSVPLIFFGQKMPAFWNPFAWLKLLFMTEMQIQGSYPYQVVVVELGSDKPGDMKEFEQYFHADYGVLTAISAEHMENFSAPTVSGEVSKLLYSLATTAASSTTVSTSSAICISSLATASISEKFSICSADIAVNTP